MAKVGRRTWVSLIAVLLIGLTLALIGAKYRREQLSRIMLRGIESGTSDVVRHCLERRASPNARDGDGFPVLTTAVTLNRIDIAELLLRHGARVEEPDNFGWTPLMFATKDGNAACVRLLLEHGAHPGRQDVNGVAAADIALGHPEIYALFHAWFQRHGITLLDQPEMMDARQSDDDSSPSPGVSDVVRDLGR